MRYIGSFALLVLVFCLFAKTTQAATDTKIKEIQNQSNQESEEYTEITWLDILKKPTELTLGTPAKAKTEKISPEAQIQDNVISGENKRVAILSKWQEKQAYLEKSLPKGKFLINASAYTAAADECGKSDGITASGVRVMEKRTLACPPQYPFGTKISIESYGTYTCEDRGGAIKGNHFDIYMETKKQAFAFGRRNLLAEVEK